MDYYVMQCYMNYVNAWFVLMWGAVVSIPFLVRLSKFRIQAILIAHVSTVVMFALWARKLQYYTIETGLFCILIMCVLDIFFVAKRWNFNKSMQLVVIAVAMFVGICMSIGDTYHEWYKANYYVSRMTDGEIHTVYYAIPSETANTRFDYGFDYYPARMYEATNGLYVVEFFEAVEDELYGPGEHQHWVEEVADNLEIVAKKPGEEDHVIEKIWYEDVFDSHTGECVDTGPIKHFTFYFEKDIAERMRKDLGLNVHDQDGEGKH